MIVEFLRQRAAWLALMMVAALVTTGCEPPPKAAPAGAGPSGAGQGSGAPAGNAPAASPNTPTPPAGVPTPPDSGAAPAAGTPAANDSSGIPPELIKQVNELVRLTKEYNAIAAKVQTLDDYKQHADALRALDEQLEPYVTGLAVEQEKLQPAARAEFERKYYEGLAKPIIEEKFAHTRRFATLQ
jgi:hypothetical protein